MMLSGTVLLLIVGTILALLAAIAHKALVEISWHDLEEYCRLNERETTFDEIHDRYDATVATTETLQVLGTLTAVLAVANAMYRLPSGDQTVSNGYFQLPYLTAIAVMATLLVTVWIPREVARYRGSAYLTRTWTIWRTANQILSPLNRLATWFRIVTRRLDGRAKDVSEEEALEDEILSIVTEGQHDGLLEDDVREMIAGVIELDDTDVAGIMTPRSQMNTIPIDMEWSEMLSFVVRVGRTRIPVYDKNLDDIVGLLYAKDLLTVLAAEERPTTVRLPDIMREVNRVPRSTRLDELLQSFLKTHSHLAIVVDEFLHVVGLVTIEDVLEEIVGEIVDESDQEEPGDIRWIDRHAAEVQGRARVEEVNEALGMQLPTSPEYETVGGFILHEFGRIPMKGETLQWRTITITVQEATRRRIERVKMEVQPKPKVVNAT